MTNTKNFWYENISETELDDILGLYNRGKKRADIIDKTTSYYQALNKLWNSSRDLIQESSDKSEDSYLFKQLILKTLSDKEKMDLCNSRELLRIIKLSPKVMNHDTLRNFNYDPENIVQEIKSKAQNAHTELETEYKRFKKNNIKPTRLIKKLTRLLYVVRSNIMHGEKTPLGPDSKKLIRDRKVCNAAVPVLELLFEYFFNYPSNYLCVYATLAPGENNNNVLKNMEGSWQDCKITGEIFTRKGLQFFKWSKESPQINAKVFSSEDLRNNLDRIDKFEGKPYIRILIPTKINGQIRIANIYSYNDTY